MCHAFRLILGREPENSRVIEMHMALRSVAELRTALLTSPEFSDKYKLFHPSLADHPNRHRDRRTVAFIHLQKTGGTSLRKMIEHNFPVERRCPVLEDRLYVLPVAELGHYDFFSGHFDISSIRFIPRDRVETVAVLREPAARLISFYRYLRSHPAGDEFEGDQLIPMAHALTAEEFFERRELRDFFAVNNHYLFALGASFCWFNEHRGHLTQESLAGFLAAAKETISGLAAVGITERYADSVRLICHDLSLPAPAAVASWNVTDRLPESDARFTAVEKVEVTDRLKAAMADLIEFDVPLYEHATREFERRLGNASTASKAAP